MIDIKRVQSHLLNIAKETVKILDSHDIHYMLALGTLLVAIPKKCK